MESNFFPSKTYKDKFFKVSLPQSVEESYIFSASKKCLMFKKSMYGKRNLDIQSIQLWCNNRS